MRCHRLTAAATPPAAQLPLSRYHVPPYVICCLWCKLCTSKQVLLCRWRIQVPPPPPPCRSPVAGFHGPHSRHGHLSAIFVFTSALLSVQWLLASGGAARVPLFPTATARPTAAA